MSVLEDLLDEGLTEDNFKITVQRIFEGTVGTSLDRAARLNRSKTLGKAKSLLEFYELVRQVVENIEMRASVPDRNKVIFTEEDPDIASETETVVFTLARRDPGSFGQGAPFESNVRNLRPICREEREDPENPGYRIAVNGYWYDNIVKFTCWARTNKAANARAEWFENLMEEYSWWFKVQGVDRVLFWGRNADEKLVVDNNKWYGRPINYYVRTEKLRAFKEKTIEEIIIKQTVDDR